MHVYITCISTLTFWLKRRGRCAYSHVVRSLWGRPGRARGWTNLVQEDVVTALEADARITGATVAKISSAIGSGKGLPLPDGTTANGMISYTLTGTTLDSLRPEQETLVKEDARARARATDDSLAFLTKPTALEAGRRRG